jgi:DUF1680 family protein
MSRLLTWLHRIGPGFALVLWLAPWVTPTRADEPSIEFHQEPGRLRITADGAPLATYVYRDGAIPRPYFAHLHAPGGIRVSRNHPPTAGIDRVDHAALHPGLWLAFGDLSGADSWRNKAPVEHEGFAAPPSGGKGKGSFAVRNAYRSAPGEPPSARETCHVTVIARSSGYLLLLRSEFIPVASDLVFGDQEEMGLGVRVATPLSVEHGGQILDAQGDRDERGVRGKASDWCDYGGKVEGRWAGITLMPDPANFRKSWFHVRDYGLMVANPFGRRALTKGPESRLVVKPGETFRLGFGVLLHAAPVAAPTDPRGAYREYLEELSRPDTPSGTRAEGAPVPAVPAPEDAGSGTSAMTARTSGAGHPTPKVESVQRALSPSAVTGLGGFIGRRVGANRVGYLMPFDIDTYVRMVENRKSREWNWVGEQPGKWLESAAWSSRQASDSELEERARAVLARLKRAQEPTGYLGITDPAVRTTEKPLRSMDAYELYFLLHALITVSQEWDDPGAIESARRLADYLTAHVGPGKAEFWPSPYRPPANRHLILGRRAIGVPQGSPRVPEPVLHSDIAGHAIHYGWEGTLLIDPVLRLYKSTGDSRLLDWSRWAVAGLDRWSGWDAVSQLDGVAAGTIGLHQLQPYAHVHTFQMNFLGFLRLYECTGDSGLLRKVIGAWNDTVHHHMTITGGVGVGEHYEQDRGELVGGKVAETCATLSWLQLNQSLLELTGDPKYADVIERVLWNQVFAAQAVDGDGHRYFTPPNGEKPRGQFRGPDCCNGSGHRMISLIPSVIYAEGKEGLFVNQFVPSSARIRLGSGPAVTLRLATRYPEQDSVTIRVDPDRPSRFTLRLRIPLWCQGAAATVNGVSWPAGDVRAGTYLVLDRSWTRGDRVDLQMPMRVTWVRARGAATEGPQVCRWALKRGPVVFAVDTVLWDGPTPPPRSVGSDLAVVRESPECCETVALPEGALGPGLKMPVELRDGSRVWARAWPFANLGAWYRPGEPRPPRDRAAFTYAVWLRSRGDAP